MRTVCVVASMVFALLSFADAQQSSQAPPTGQFDVLVGKWTGTHTRVGSGGLVSKGMVIEKVAPDGKISGYLTTRGVKMRSEEFKAEKKGDFIHLFYKSANAEEFAGQLVGRDQISGNFLFRNEQEVHSGTIQLTFTRER